MKISIITATYNSAATVRDTLESILRQSWQDWEVIIKDGGSHDETLPLCREYAERAGGRIRIISCPDKGIYDAMNQGIAAATGDVVGLLNSDDMYYDDRVLERIAAAMTEDEGLGCVFANLLMVDAKDTDRVLRVWRGSPYRKKAFRKGWHPAHPTFYARRQLFEELGGFDTDFAVSADFELMLRFLEKNGVPSRWLPYYFVKMRSGGESTGSLRNFVRGNRNILRAFTKNGFSRPPFYLVKRLAPKVWAVLKAKLGVRPEALNND